MAIAAALALALAAAPPPGAAGRPKIAMLDFTAVGASRELAAAAGAVAANELDRLGGFQVVTSEAIRDMLALEKQRQMLGCTDAACLADIGGALGVDYLVSGKVTRLAAGAGLPATWTLDLTLSSVRRAQREGSALETARSEPELLALARRAVSRLVSKVLAARTGRLLLAASESGAVVRVDEQVKGTTPLPGPLVLPSGIHLVSLEKQGFVAWQKEVQVQAGGLEEERATLVPSPDFVRDYESRQRKMRLGAWLATGLSAVAAGAAVYFQVHAADLYGSESTPGTFLYSRARILAGTPVEGGVDHAAEAADLKSRIEASQNLSYVAMGVGGAAAVAAAYFWIAGDDPDRYAGFRGAISGLEVFPLPGGAAARLSLRF